jgi:predicted O-methyltransferase YrrM
MTRSYLAGHEAPVTILDIGTAKGFSALCLQWALMDSGRLGAVVSVDVLDPNGRELRNSVAELDGPKTLAEFLKPWPEATAITFLKFTGVDWLRSHPARVHVAFVDGKHSGSVAYQEGLLLAAGQESGDLAIFDDVQIDGIALAVKQLRKFYQFEELVISDVRRYAIGVRRG